MKCFRNLGHPLLLLLGLSMGIVACKKTNTPDPTPQPDPKPVTSITSIDPATAPVGSTIAVNGTNFSTDPASNTITIGGVTATVVSATATRLVVVVPAGAANGPVTVTAGGQTAQSQILFTVTVIPLKPVAEKQGTIYTNPTWSKDTIYVLRGMVYIPEDHTLTIEPGTVIKGAGPERDPAGTNRAGALIIERRAQLIAKGTVAQPIVFTSAKPAGQRNYGDWGGLVLVGRSPVNQPKEQLYPNGVRGTVEAYGEPFDNSGTLQYVRIEYAGAVQPGTVKPVVPVTKLSGLTLIGVGAKTIIDHVQVSYSGSDAFSWFGGSANVKNLVSYANFDDDWNADWGYVGNVQFGVAVRNPEVADQSGSNGFEVENYNPAENTDAPPVILFNELPQAAPVFANISSFAFAATPTTTNSTKGTGPYRSGIYLRRNSAITIYNSLFYGYPEGLRLEATTGLKSGGIDLRGIVLANMLTPVVGAGVVTNEQATAYFTAADRTNQVVASTDLASLLLNNFNVSGPSFLPRAGSPLLTGAVTGGKLANSFFTPVTYRGAFGQDDWTTGWTNFNPQSLEYAR